MLNNPDVTYTQGSAAVWSAVEINIGILCNCLAMLKPFVRRHLPWLKSLIGVRSGGASGGERWPPSNGKNIDSGPHGRHLHRHSDHHLYHDRRGEARSLGYQLHSFGRDKQFGSTDRPDLDSGNWAEGGSRAGSGSGSDIGASHDAPVQKGILVTTTVAMGRSSEGDISTEDILGTERGEHYTAISAPARAAGT